MEYIIFGAGDDGKDAFCCLGQRVGCFCDNNLAGGKLYDKDIISFEEMHKRYQKGQSIVVVASSKYQLEMEWQLKKYDIDIVNAERKFTFIVTLQQEYTV